jgi:hypothetical protein
MQLQNQYVNLVKESLEENINKEAQDISIEKAEKLLNNLTGNGVDVSFQSFHFNLITEIYKVIRSGSGLLLQLENNVNVSLSQIDLFPLRIQKDNEGRHHLFQDVKGGGSIDISFKVDEAKY